MLSKEYIYSFIASKGIPPSRYDGEDDDWDSTYTPHYISGHAWSDWVTSIVGVFTNTYDNDTVDTTLSGISFPDLDCSYSIYATLYHKGLIPASPHTIIISRRI